MDKTQLFASHLREVARSRNMDAGSIARALAFRRTWIIERWCSGRALPPLRALLPLANALDVDVIELILGWVIQQAPELELIIHDQVLSERSSPFPRSDEYLKMLAWFRRRREPPDGG